MFFYKFSYLLKIKRISKFDTDKAKKNIQRLEEELEEELEVELELELLVPEEELELEEVLYTDKNILFRFPRQLLKRLLSCCVR